MCNTGNKGATRRFFPQQQPPEGLDQGGGNRKKPKHSKNILAHSFNPAIAINYWTATDRLTHTHSYYLGNNIKTRITFWYSEITKIALLEIQLFKLLS